MWFNEDTELAIPRRIYSVKYSDFQKKVQLVGNVNLLSSGDLNEVQMIEIAGVISVLS